MEVKVIEKWKSLFSITYQVYVDGVMQCECRNYNELKFFWDLIMVGHELKINHDFKGVLQNVH